MAKPEAHIQEHSSKAALKVTVGSRKEERLMKEGDFKGETLNLAEVVELK